MTREQELTIEKMAADGLMSQYPGGLAAGSLMQGMAEREMAMAAMEAERRATKESATPPCETTSATTRWFLLGGALVLIVTALTSYFTTTPSLYTEYSAVRLTNGDTYYGKLKGLGSKFPVMTEVFTIADSVTPTGQQGSIMRPRANEFHAPARTILNSEQILFVESVAAASQVGQLIKKMPKQ